MHVSAVVDPELEISVCTDLIAFTVFLFLLQSAVCNSKGRVYSAQSCSSKALVYFCIIRQSFILSCSLISDFSKLPYSLLHPLWLLQRIQLISFFLPQHFLLLGFFFFFNSPSQPPLPLFSPGCNVVLGIPFKTLLFLLPLIYCCLLPCSPSFLVLSSYIPEI